MPKVYEGHGPNAHRLILSLCDYSGNWPRPYAEAGYTVLCFDLKHGDDLRDPASVIQSVWEEGRRLNLGAWRIHGILAAPPCTTFTNSGARWWPKHDASGETVDCLAVLDGCLEVIRHFDPPWWALENPAGRLPKLRPGLGKPGYYFHPWQYAKRSEFVKPAPFVDGPGHYADCYTKLTGVWGNARRPEPDTDPLQPIMIEKRGKDGRVLRGSWMWANLGGKSERTKTLRSNTPMGFARAFFDANP
jgi:hypothetical protein